MHNRRTIRLRKWDYSRPGAYFVTICARDRECLFGEITDSTMELNAFGNIVRDEWKRAFQIRHELQMDEYIIMPNHFHGIVIIVGARWPRPDLIVQLPDNGRDDPAPTIGKIIARFKYESTKRINNIRHTPGRPVWQRNYYDHIIRDKESFHKIRQYIRSNPAGWESDEENHGSRSLLHVAMLDAQKQIIVT
jgi:putative transposase